MTVLRSRIFFAFSGSALTLESLQANPLVPGVSVITEGPAKGHFKFDSNDQPVPVFVDSTTLEQVMACAQTYAGGLRVNAGHFTGVLEAAGFLSSYRVDGQQLRADMTLFPTFEKFAHLCSLIVTIPDTFGLSIDFSGPSEFRDGKAFARCTEIYSADLVPVPAANDRGLFGAGFVFCDCGKITPSFDNPKTSMTIEQLSQQITAAVDNFNAATAKIDGVITQVGELETKLGAIGDVAALTTQLGEIKTVVDEIKVQDSELRTKLSNRMGIEFAARAGAKPAAGENPAAEGGDTRKPFEIPTSEKNTDAVRSLLGLK